MSENNKAACLSCGLVERDGNNLYVVSVDGIPRLWTWNRDEAISRATYWLRSSIDVSSQGCGDYVLKVPLVRVTRADNSNSA